MTTRQLEANRRNAAKSTGPRTQLGKAASSKNACTHGFTAATIILSTEDGSLFDELRQNLHDELRPVGFIERGLVEEIAVSRWRQRRCAIYEARLLEDEMKRRAKYIKEVAGHSPETQAANAFKDLSENFKGLRDASLYEYRHRRNYEKVMKELEARQKVRKQAEETKAPAPEPEPEIKEEKAEIEKVKNEAIPKIEHLEIDTPLAAQPAPEPSKREDEWPKAC